MILKRKMGREELLYYLYQFDKLYSDGLDNTELQYIFKNCELGNILDSGPYILNQFYTEFDLLKDNKNIYLSLLKKIKSSFSLENKRILEVGGGPTPQLGKLLAKESKEITVMDTSLSIKNNNIPNLYLENYYFLPFTDISKYDLVVAYLACGAAESIIYNCTKNNTDFFIGICPCSRDAINEVINDNLTDSEYIDGIIELAKMKVNENNMGFLRVEKLDDLPSYDFPIIYNKRVKKIQYKRDV